MRKAAEVLGLGADAVRTVPVDDDFRMDVRALRAAVAADRAAGRRPFCDNTHRRIGFQADAPAGEASGPTTPPVAPPDGASDA